MSASCVFFHELLRAFPGITLSVSIFREIEIFDSATEVRTSMRIDEIQTLHLENRVIFVLKEDPLLRLSEDLNTKEFNLEAPTKHHTFDFSAVIKDILFFLHIF